MFYRFVRFLHRIGFFFSSIIWILTFATILIDGFQASVIDDLDGCYAPSTGGTWGASAGVNKAMNCSMSEEADFTYSNGAISTCVCVNHQGKCYGYDLASGSDCGTIFTLYYNELAASCAFSTSLCLLVSVYIVLAGKKIRLRENEALNSVPIPTQELRLGEEVAGQANASYLVVQAVNSDDIEVNHNLQEQGTGYSLVPVGIRVQAVPLV